MIRPFHTALLAFPLFASSAFAQAASLRAAAEAVGLNFGLATNSFNVSNSAYATAVKAQFSMVVCENEMKFDQTENPIGKFNYGGGDAVSAFADANGMKMRGHNFIWHSQSTSAQNAVHDRASGLKVMRDHITAVGGHFKTKILEWDVLNEITDDANGNKLRDGSSRPSSFWDANIGDDFCDSALSISRQVIGTNGNLYYNDYSADGVNGKSTAIYNLAKHWQQNGVPVDGIGLQSHLASGLKRDDISANVKRFGDLGLRISMTEIDITNSKTEDWVNLMNACLDNFNCTSFVVWGLADGSSWLGSRCGGCLLYSGSANSPQPKNEIIQALIDAMSKADPAVVAKRKEFIKRTPGTTALYARQAAFRVPNSNWLGAAPVPLFSNGTKDPVDILGRSRPVAPHSPWGAGLGILPQ